VTSRSATVLVIFIVAVIAFCLASVFASMTGPISILPNETESGGIMDNLSAITDDTSESDNSYDYSDDDYSSDYSSSYGADGYDVETTSDDSSSSSSSSSDASGYENSAPDVETTTDESSSGSEVETTTG
jgi:hypothetical protein